MDLTGRKQQSESCKETERGREGAREGQKEGSKRGRITVTGAVASLRSEKREEKAGVENGESIEEKDRRIRELQEQIIHKKLSNDKVQEAFRRRIETGQSSAERAVKWAQVTSKYCGKLARSQPRFKRGVLRVLVGALRVSGKSRLKAAKILLAWLLGWSNHLFAFLAHALSKK